MTPTRSHDLDRITLLAEPVRRRLYEFVVGQAEPVDRDAAAAGAGIGRPLAAFHLDRLAEAGLLDVTFRRRSGRTGPGAGRPAKFYARARHGELSVSVPPRHYDLAATILADGLERGAGSVAPVIDAAREQGGRLAAEASRDRPVAPRAVEVLAGQGYEPVADADGVVRLRNCPFDALVDDYRDLTCSMNLALLEGVVEGVGEPDVVARADPREGYCCVTLVPQPA
jgi:predicted ArsR family transcriptional regulator